MVTREIYQIENSFPNVPTLVRIQTQTNAKHLKINLYRENSPLPHVIFATFALIVSWQILDWMSFNVSYHLSLNKAVWGEFKIGQHCLQVKTEEGQN